MIEHAENRDPSQVLLDTISQIVRSCRTESDSQEFLKQFATAAARGLEALDVRIWVLRGDELKLVVAWESPSPPQSGGGRALSPEDESQLIRETFTSGEPRFGIGMSEGRAAMQSGESGAPRPGIIYLRYSSQGKPAGVARFTFDAPASPGLLQNRARQAEDLLGYIDLFSEIRLLRLGQAEEASLARLVGLARTLHGTLDVKELSYILVNTAKNLMNMDRACLGLAHKGRRVELAAVSGVSSPERKSAAGRSVEDLMTRVLEHGKAFCLNRGLTGGETLDVPYMEELKSYLESTRLVSMLAYPLSDEKGELGVLFFESAKEGNFTRNDLRIGEAFAAEAVTALSNAKKFQELPFLATARKLAALRKRLYSKRSRAIAPIAIGVAAVYFLAFFPFDIPVRARCVVKPLVTHPVSARVESTVAEVLASEGKEVKRGEVLLRLESRDFEQRLAKARAEREAYVKDAVRLRAEGQEADALIEEDRIKAVAEDIALYEQAIRDCEIASPADGVVLTPKTELLLGKGVRQGEQVLEIADLTKLSLEVGIPEKEIARAEVGSRLSVSFQALPGESVHSEVVSIRSRSEDWGGKNVFVAEAGVENPDGVLRPGMTGKAWMSTNKRALLGFLWQKFSAYVQYH